MTAGSTFSSPATSARRQIATERGSHGFLLSLLLHGSVAAVVLFAAYVSYEKPEVARPILELVPGAQVDDGPTQTAPLRVVGGIKVTLPKPAPRHLAPQVPEVEMPSTGSAGAVHPVATPKPRPKPAPSRPATNSHPGTGTDKPVRLDPDGIRAGLIGGISAKPNGSGPGTALTSDQRNALQEYQVLIADKIRMELNDRPGVGAGLVVEVELHLLSDGSITRVHVVKSSGSAEFDQLVQETLRKLRLPPRPPGLDEYQRFPICGINSN